MVEEAHLHSELAVEVGIIHMVMLFLAVECKSYGVVRVFTKVPEKKIPLDQGHFPAEIP